ncbi:MAG TPA: ankyrin repeat domain-containing protein [Terriglobia bacterium]|nr:ankyrin repeat domain-containing protein [Terriglobia bacterium]
MKTWIAAGLLVATVSFGFAAPNDLRLIQALKGKDAAAVRALLKSGVDVNAAQGDGATALHWAAHYDDLATADLLLRAGSHVNVANDLGVTPLYLACTNRNAAMVRKLLDAGADSNAKLLNGETVLMNCARTGNAASVKALLAAGAKVNAKESEHNQTALMWAAAQKHPDVVQALLEAGADIHARSRTYAQIVTSEVTQRAGREELNYTVLRGGSTPLLFGARSGDAESVRLLLAAGADVNETLPNGMSALVLAAQSGNAAAGEVLLERGADPNAAGIGYTALHAAVLRSDLSLVNALLVQGANPNAQVTKGTPLRRNSQDFNLPASLIGATAYWLAAKFAEPELMRALAAGGADPEMPIRDGTTPLMAAAGLKERSGRAAADADRRGVSVIDGGRLPDESRVAEAVTMALLQRGDINAKNRNGDTALHAAVSMGYDRVVKVLADKGAQLNVKNNRGLTPLGALTGRGQGSAAADTVLYPTTADLLRRLGAVE